MLNIDKTQHLRKKLNSIKTDRQIKQSIEGVSNNVFAFLSLTSCRDYNIAYIEEFGYIHLVSDFEEGVDLFLTTIEDSYIDYVDAKDTLLMLSKVRIAVDCILVYLNGKKEKP